MMKRHGRREVGAIFFKLEILKWPVVSAKRKLVVLRLSVLVVVIERGKLRTHVRHHVVQHNVRRAAFGFWRKILIIFGVQ